MPMLVSVPEGFSLLIWLRSVSDTFVTAASIIVFAFLDLLDVILCLVYGFVDGAVEKSPISCYCYAKNREQKETEEEEAEREEEVSETLCRRKNLFREMAVLSLRKRSGREEERGVSGSGRRRWSDCSCDTCSGTLPDRREEERLLHLLVKEPISSLAEESRNKIDSPENVLFIHGFLSSSSFWSETIFPETAERSNCRMFAVDLLGFGRSPKPTNCSYRLKDHIDMIERSVVEPFRLNSFHLVAHSMGCIIALALAAKYPTYVESVTLVAPPYFPSDDPKASYNTLNKLAERRIWPPLLFGSSVMSWYEHVGRTFCLVYCRNHLIWEWILKAITWKRDLSSAITDVPMHTHHSAWHTMHNVICGGAKFQDKNLQVVKKAGIPVKVIHGDKDQVVPIECSCNMKSKFPFADLIIVKGADHRTVIIGREKDFTKELVDFWLFSRKQKLCVCVCVCEYEKLI